MADEGKTPIFFPGVLPPVVSSPASPSSGAGVQLGWAKAWPCHSRCPGEFNMVVGRLQLAGRGEQRRGFIGVHGHGCNGSESPVGGACELHGASTTMVGMLKELLVLPVAPAMVVGQSRGGGAPTRCGAATQGSGGLHPRLRCARRVSHHGGASQGVNVAFTAT